MKKTEIKKRPKIPAPKLDKNKLGMVRMVLINPKGGKTLLVQWGTTDTAGWLPCNEYSVVNADTSEWNCSHRPGYGKRPAKWSNGHCIYYQEKTEILTQP